MSSMYLQTWHKLECNTASYVDVAAIPSGNNAYIYDCVATTQRRVSRIKIPSNCSNCNAPGIPGNDKCPYCGTPYEREEIAY